MAHISHTKHQNILWPRREGEHSKEGRFVYRRSYPSVFCFPNTIQTHTHSHTYMHTLFLFLTSAMRAAPTPMSGETAMMTRVSFQPLTKPMRKPHTKVVKRWMNMPTWSAMASFILLMSLKGRGERQRSKAVSPSEILRGFVVIVAAKSE